MYLYLPNLSEHPRYETIMVQFGDEVVPAIWIEGGMKGVNSFPANSVYMPQNIKFA